MLSHRNLGEIAAAGQSLFGVTGEDRLAVVTPLFHLYGLREIDLAFASAATLVLPADVRFPAPSLQLFASARVTGLAAVPSWLSLYRETDRRSSRPGGLASIPRDRYGSVIRSRPAAPSRSFCRVRALSLPTAYRSEPRVLARCERAVNAARSAERWQTLSRCRARIARRGGRRRESRRPERDGHDGQLELARCNTGSLTEGGDLLTPDYGCFDSGGALHLLGRIDEVINCGGRKISPVEIEEALAEHPMVAASAAVAAPDPAGVLGRLAQLWLYRGRGVCCLPPMFESGLL